MRKYPESGERRDAQERDGGRDLPEKKYPKAGKECRGADE